MCSAATPCRRTRDTIPTSTPPSPPSSPPWRSASATACLSPDLQRQGNNGLPVAADVPLAADFFDPDILNGQGQPTTIDPVTGLTTTNIGAVLKGDADVDAQAEDVQAVNEVRNLLFNEVVPGVGYGQDLIALDIERGRDNGIGSYNQVRVALGLPAVTSFAQITSNVQVQHELQEATATSTTSTPSRAV